MSIQRHDLAFWFAFGPPTLAGIESDTRRGTHQLGKALAELPEVMEAYLLTGEYNYLINVAVAGTAGYERFLREKLYRIPGIRQSRSTFALRCLKRIHSVLP